MFVTGMHIEDKSGSRKWGLLCATNFITTPTLPDNTCPWKILLGILTTHTVLHHCCKHSAITRYYLWSGMFPMSMGPIITKKIQFRNSIDTLSYASLDIWNLMVCLYVICAYQSANLLQLTHSQKMDPSSLCHCELTHYAT